MDVNEVLRKAREAPTVGRSFGPAYEHEGKLVIPVAVVAGGGGGGVRGDQQLEHPADAGGGFGGLVYPVGAYVVREDGARFVPSVDVNLIVVCGLLLFRLLLRASGKRRVHR